jgi:DNA-binding XRE family transcriptional regulator
MSINTPFDISMCEPSTPICVESVLEPRGPAWYRRQMARKKVAEISGMAIRAAREKLGLSQSELAARIKGIDQQDVSRAELEGVKGGDRKAKIARYLGLQRHNVSDTTNGIQPVAQEHSGDYLLPLFEPWLVEGKDMAFAVEASAKIKPPSFPAGADTYAFRMVGDAMSPRYNAGEALYTDPERVPEAGKCCIFYNADRTKGRVGEFLGATPEMWHARQYKPSEPFDLPRDEWPICHRIVGTHTP